jgi:hypothetical protein
VTFVVLVILTLIWALYLASWFHSRAQERSTNSISSFNQHLSVLQRSRPVGLAAPSLEEVGATPLIRSAVPRPHDPLVRPPQVRGLTGGTPITLQDARRRRRDVLMTLVTLVVATAVPFALYGGLLLVPLAVAGGLLTSYVFLLVRAQKLAEEREEKVHYLPQPAEVYEPAAYVQYSVN